MGFSTKYFIPIRRYHLGIPLNCTKNNSNMTDGKIVVYSPGVSKFHDLIMLIINFTAFIIICTKLYFC